MKIRYNKHDENNKSPLKRYIVYGVLAIILALFNFAFVDIISIEGLSPDFLIILCVWIALYEGQFIGIIAAFFMRAGL